MNADALIELLPNAAIEFFVTFSRFEYALKRAGLLRNTVDAQADWDSFANDRLGKPFFEMAQASGKAGTLLDSPPNKQIVENHQLNWRTVDKPRSVSDLFACIRRLRNNLFHGGKFSSGLVEEPARNEQLLAEALWILWQALDKADDVREHFHAFSG